MTWNTRKTRPRKAVVWPCEHGKNHCRPCERAAEGRIDPIPRAKGPNVSKRQP